MKVSGLFFLEIIQPKERSFKMLAWSYVGLKRVLQKRRRIQSGKRVADDYIWNLFEKERFWQRLTRRILKV